MLTTTRFHQARRGDVYYVGVFLCFAMSVFNSSSMSGWLKSTAVKGHNFTPGRFHDKLKET